MMIYICTYVVLLFTVQCILIVNGIPSWWLLTLWGFLIVILCLRRKHFQLPQDHPHFHDRRRVVLFWLAGLFFLLIAYVYLQIYVSQHNQSAILEVVEEQVTQGENVKLVQGKLVSSIEIDGGRIRFLLAVERIGAKTFSRSEKVVLTRYADDKKETVDFAAISRGDQWSGFVELSLPSTARNPGAFDYRQYLFRQGIQVTGIITNKDWQKIENNRLGMYTLLGLLDNQRQAWMNQVDSIFNGDVAPIVKAMTVGYRDELQPELLETYQELGIIHLLAISGLHVGIILWLVYTLLSKLAITRETIYLVLFLFIPMYIYLSGAQVSVIRAGMMAMVVLIALRFRLWQHSLLGLYLVYVLTLLYNPYYLFQVGYQLSFGVTFALITFYPAIRELFEWLPERLNSLLSVALIAQVVSLPIILLHFYQFSPVSLVLNMVLVPLYSLAYIPGGTILILLSFAHVDLVRFPIWLYELSLYWIHQTLDWVHTFSWSTLHVGLPQLWWFVLYVVVAILWALYSERKRTISAWVCLCLIPLLIVVQIAAPYVDKRAHIMLLDVGQSEAIVIEYPYRDQVVLIDVGDVVRFEQPTWKQRSRAFQTGKDIVLPYLRYRGINRVDKIVFSHGHYDHVAGIEGLLGNIQIEQVLKSPVLPQTDFKREVLINIQDHDIPIYALGRGDEWQGKHTLFHVLFPEKEDGFIEKVNNVHDYNVVLWNRIYDTTFIWQGDLETEGESKIAKMYPQLQADIIKIGHHGSNTSTSAEWLEHIAADVSLISVGRSNRYGHPTPMVIERLQQHDMTIFRTDQHGGIYMQIYPNKVIIKSTLQAYRESVQ